MVAVFEIKKFFQFKRPLTELGTGVSDPMLFSFGQEFSQKLATRSDKELAQFVSIVKKEALSDKATAHHLPFIAIVTACEKSLVRGSGLKGLTVAECFAVSGLLMLGVVHHFQDDSFTNINAEGKHVYISLVENLMWNYRVFKILKAFDVVPNLIEKQLPPMMSEVLLEAVEIGGKVALRKKAMTAVDAKKVKSDLLKNEVLARYAEQRSIGRLKFGRWNSPMEASKDLYHTMVEPTKRVNKDDGQEDTRWRTTYEWLLEFEKNKKK